MKNESTSKYGITAWLLVLLLAFADSAAGAVPTAVSTQHVTCWPASVMKRLFELSPTWVVAYAFSPDQRFIYILESTVVSSAAISPTSGMSAEGNKLLLKFDVSTGKVKGQINLGRPGPHQPISSTATGAMVINHDGSTLYVANNQKWISVVDTVNWKVLRRFDVTPLDPKQILLSPDGKTLYVRSNLIPDYGFALAGYATATGKREWISSEKAGHYNYMSLAYWPEEKSLIAAVLGTTPYNTVGGDQGLRLIGPQTGKVGEQVAKGPYAFAIAGKGLTLFAARYSNNEAIPSADLLLLDGKNGKIMQKVPKLKGLHSLVYDASRDVLYAGYLSSKPHADKSVITAYKGTSLQALSSVTCDSFMLAARSMGFMKVAMHREGVYVVGPYWLWLLKTDSSGAFSRD